LKHDPSLGYEVYSALGTTTGITGTGTETGTQTITETSPTTVTGIMLRLFRDALFLIISLVIILTVIIALIYRTRKIKKELGI
jgi:flagellar biogenesis protein FliO